MLTNRKRSNPNICKTYVHTTSFFSRFLQSFLKRYSKTCFIAAEQLKPRHILYIRWFKLKIIGIFMIVAVLHSADFYGIIILITWHIAALWRWCYWNNFTTFGQIYISSDYNDCISNRMKINWNWEETKTMKNENLHTISPMPNIPNN